MDTNLFIDTQYSDAERHAASDSLIFRRAYYKDTPIMSTVPEELRIEHNHRCYRAEQYHRDWLADRAYKIQEFKIRMSNNLKNSYADRWNGCAMQNIPKLRHLLHDAAKAIQQKEWDGVKDHLNSLPDTLAQRVFVNIDNFEVFYCFNCTSYQLKDDSEFDNNDNLICESCISDDYLYSECMGTYIHCEHACRVYHSVRDYNNDNIGDYCTTRYGRNNFNDYGNIFFSDYDDYCEVANCDNEDEDENEDRLDGLDAWHNAPRNFVESNESKKWPTLGVELEVYAPERGELVEALRYEYDTDTMILERDGSLNDNCGIELISQPFGREEWDTLAPNMLAILKKHRAVGYNDPAGSGYGIHVTIHRRYMSPLAEARMSMFLASSDNTNFVRAVAQREQIYHPEGNTGIGQMTSDRKKVSCISYENSCKYHRNFAPESYNTKGKLRIQRKITGKGKYCPINWKGDLAEFRLFQSTVNPSSFMKNLEFVWALQAWTKPEAATGNTFHYSDFVRWLNKPANRNDYPQLTAFLSKKVFYGTNYQPILSTWHNLMVKPVEEEAIEPILA